MDYPINRFIEHDLHLSLDEFCQQTGWNQETLDQWQNEHYPIIKLPIAILYDLSQLGSNNGNISATLTRLNQYQDDYIAYARSLRNSFSRIPNSHYLMNDIEKFDPTENEEHLLSIITADLDDYVYADPFTVNEAMDEKKIRHSVKAPCQINTTFYEILLEFVVKILEMPTGKPLAIYEYIGHKVKTAK